MPVYPSLSGCCSACALTVACGVFYVIERAGDSVTANARRDHAQRVSPTVRRLAPIWEYPPRGYKTKAAILQKPFSEHPRHP